MVERFFSGVPNGAGATDSIMLLSGPPSSGKTSLLFQFAINCALEAAGHNIVFMCNKGRFENNPPSLSQGVDASSEAFQRIHMKYVEDDQGIKKYFAAFHLHDEPPAAVIIDDFGDFFDDRNLQNRHGNARGRDLAIVHTLALCCDAVKQSKRGSCKLLLSDTHQGDIPRSLFIYKRWVPCLFSIKGDNQGLYILKKNSILGKNENKTSAKYSIALQYLVLEEIIIDG